MRFYNFLVGLNLPGNYVGKILMVSFLGVHVPVIGLAAFAVLFGPIPLSESWPFLAATVGFTGIGTALTLWANYALLAPVRASSSALRQYLSDKTVVVLPGNRQDDAGQLMSDVYESITRLDHAIDALQGMLNESEEKRRATFAVLSEMSHELRTPLNHIIGFSAMMQNDTLKPLGRDAGSEYADIINASGEELLDVIERILELSQIESERRELEPEAVDATETARNAFGLTHHHATGREVSLELASLPNFAWVEADSDAVKQVYLQSMMAMVDAADDGARITVSVGAEDETIQLEVEDSITPFRQSDVPEPLRAQFGRQLEEEDTQFAVASRVGLSLVVVHALTGRLGGNLFLANKPSGRGKRMVVSLPVVKSVPDEVSGALERAA